VSRAWSTWSWPAATQDVDPQLVSIAHGGQRADSGNYDDGTLNYEQGDLISNMLRTTGQITLRRDNLGIHEAAGARRTFGVHGIVE